MTAPTGAPRLVSCVSYPVAVRTVAGPYLLEQGEVPTVIAARKLRSISGRAGIRVTVGDQTVHLDQAASVTDVVNLPSPEDGVVYLVEPDVAAAAPGRDDLVAVHGFALGSPSATKVLVSVAATAV